MLTEVQQKHLRAATSATTLVHVEEYTDSKTAIAREKELTGWTRAKKEALIAADNPEWLFLHF